MPNKFYLLIAFLLGTLCAIAGNGGPPTPGIAGKRKPPPPPGLSIDENISVLLIIALLFGFYIIYSHRLKTKAPI
ncbi:hypothetical protein ACFX5D_09390 [Flavobacterium sp. LB3P45]|uniref:Signal peptidase n=1 Tax=Flavobacterium fructosi TaxID=3230416 RepID=A0ABW6HMB3_9FLAO